MRLATRRVGLDDEGGEKERGERADTGVDLGEEMEEGEGGEADYVPGDEERKR